MNVRVDRMGVMKFSQGQAIVLALLLTAVVLTVGLAVVSQSVVDVRTSTQSQEVVQAFSAAEAGIQQSLNQAVSLGQMSPVSGNVGNGSFNATIAALGEGDEQYVFPRDMVSGDAQTLWFVSHSAGGDLGCPCSSLTSGSTFKVYWGKQGMTGSEVPALVLDVYYKSPAGGPDYSNIKVARAAYDPAARANSFTSSGINSAGYTLLGQPFGYYTTVDLGAAGLNVDTYSSSDGIQMIRARILYSTGTAQPVGFDFTGSGLVTGTNSGLASQGFIPDSQGSVGVSGTATSATIHLTSVYAYPDPPSVFDYAIFGGAGSILK